MPSPRRRRFRKPSRRRRLPSPVIAARSRDWLAGLIAGALLGLVILGVGSRIGMRLIGVINGQSPGFTIGGSMTVVLLGAASGAVIAAIFLALRTILPARRWIRGALFWTIVGAVALRGLRPVTMLNAGIFLPLFVLHGTLLHAFWCRIYLARRLTIPS